MTNSTITSVCINYKDIFSGSNSFSSLIFTLAKKNTNTLDIRNTSEDPKIVCELRDKPIYYLKADKGSNIVIMDKIELCAL